MAIGHCQVNKTRSKYSKKDIIGKQKKTIRLRILDLVGSANERVPNGIYQPGIVTTNNNNNNTLRGDTEIGVRPLTVLKELPMMGSHRGKMHMLIEPAS